MSAALGDVVIVQASGTRTASLVSAFRDPDADVLTISAASSNPAVATVTVSADGSNLTVTGVTEGSATISVTARERPGWA